MSRTITLYSMTFVFLVVKSFDTQGSENVVMAVTRI